MRLILLLLGFLACTSGDDFRIDIVEIEMPDDGDAAMASNDTEVTGPTTSVSFTEPTTPTTEEPWRDYHTRINVLNKTEGEFIGDNEERFKTAVALYTMRYCNEPEGASCNLPSTTQEPETTDNPEVTVQDDTFHVEADVTANNIDPSNVIIEKREQVGIDLQVGFFVQLEGGFMLPQGVLESVMETYKTNISADSGISFELIRDDPITTPETGTETPPTGGLEPWEIALIVLGSVGGAAIIAGAVYHFVFKKKKDTRFRELDYESTSRLHEPGRNAHTYATLPKNRESVAPDGNAGATSTFNNPSFTNSAFEMNETNNRR